MNLTPITQINYPDSESEHGDLEDGSGVVAGARVGRAKADLSALHSGPLGSHFHMHECGLKNSLSVRVLFETNLAPAVEGQPRVGPVKTAVWPRAPKVVTAALRAMGSGLTQPQDFGVNEECFSGITMECR